MAATRENEFNYQIDYQENAIPHYLRLSPLGCHVTIPSAFLRQQGNLDEHTDAYTIEDPISYYNQTHSEQRVCGVCRIWFYVGESIGDRQYNCYFDYSVRPPPPPVGHGRCPKAIEEMQRRRSACGPICNKVLKKPNDKQRTQRICNDVMRGSCGPLRRLLFQKPVMRRTQLMNIHVEAGSTIDWALGLKVVFRDYDDELAPVGNHPRSGGQEGPPIQTPQQPAETITEQAEQAEQAEPHVGSPILNLNSDGPVSLLDTPQTPRLDPWDSGANWGV